MPPGADVGNAPAKRRRRRFLVIAGIAVAVALILGVRYLAYATTHETTDDARVAADDVTVGSKIGERVKRILVDTDQRVTRGQAIILLNSKDEQNAVA
jgi:multidrug resistance efflux pump